MIERPQPDEYPAFAATYVNMVPAGADVMQLLTNTQETYSLFNSMDNTCASYAYAPDKWTLKQVLGHLIDTERIFAYRALAFSRVYEELPGFEQDDYVLNAGYESRAIQSLANEFRAVRQANLYLFNSFTAGQLLKNGLSSNYKVTVRALVYMTAGHELHHHKL